MNKILTVTILIAVLFVGSFGTHNNIYATPFFENGQFTSNGIEWCQENLPLYEILGEEFFVITNTLLNQGFVQVCIKIIFGIKNLIVQSLKKNGFKDSGKFK